MKRIGIRDLKNHATQLLRRDELLLVQRHGRDVGVYVPLGEMDAAPLEVRLRIFQQVTDEIARSARRKGISEGDFVRHFKTLRSRKSRAG